MEESHCAEGRCWQYQRFGVVKGALVGDECPGYQETLLLVRVELDPEVCFDVPGLTTDCLLYTSDAADDLLCVDLGGRRIIKKKKIYGHSDLPT